MAPLGSAGRANLPGVTRAKSLPPELLQAPFSVDAAAQRGVPYSRLRRRDLHRPFAGVRTREVAADLDARCAAYLAKMSERELFSHGTAALLWGIPLPLALAGDEWLDVSVIVPGRAPRDAGVRGHHLVPRPGLRTLLNGFPIANPVETWCQLGTVLQFPDLVAAGDALVAKGRPNVRSTLVRMHAALTADRPCIARLREAYASLRPGTRSRQESLLRLAVVGSGLPEPLVNALVTDDDGEVIAEGDLVFEEYRTILEYEGDMHRLDPRQFRRDITRRELLLDARWHTIRITAADVTRASTPATMARIRRRLLHQAEALDLPLSAVSRLLEAAESGKSSTKRRR